MKDTRGEPVDGLDAAGFAAGEESVHAHCAAGRVRTGGLGEPRPWPGHVAVRVVLQLERGGLCVRFGFEERAPRSSALGKLGGEERSKRVREEGVYFWGIEYWLGIDRP